MADREVAVVFSQALPLGDRASVERAQEAHEALLRSRALGTGGVEVCGVWVDDWVSLAIIREAPSPPPKRRRSHSAPPAITGR